MDDQEWQQAQRELARDVGQVVRQTPGAMREALGPQGRQTTDLSRAAQQLQRDQQALVQHTAEAQRIEATQADLAALAREQAQLAGQIGQFQQQAAPVQPATQPASQAQQSAAEAARTLATTQPAQAVQQQAAARRPVKTKWIILSQPLQPVLATETGAGLTTALRDRNAA